MIQSARLDHLATFRNALQHESKVIELQSHKERACGDGNFLVLDSVLIEASGVIGVEEVCLLVPSWHGVFVGSWDSTSQDLLRK
jgi:hypothetical protein